MMKPVQILLHMFDRPVAAMQSVVERPKSWWLPALLLLATTALLIVVSAPYLIELADAQQLEMIDRLSSQLSEEQLQAAREQVQGSTTLTSLLLSGVLAGGIMMGLGWLARAAIVHFSAMAMGGNSSWSGTFAAVGVWSMLPDAVRNLLQTVFVLIKGQTVLYNGLSFLVATGDTITDGLNPLYAFLSGVDLFTLWHVVLLTIAVTTAAKLKRGKGIFLAVATWVVLAGLRLVPTLISGAFMSSSLG